MTGKLYIEIHTNRSNGDATDKQVFASIESYVALYVYEFCDKPSSIELNFVEHNEDSRTDDFPLMLNIDQFQYKQIKLDRDNHEVSDLKMPMFVKESTSIAGLCAVCREIVSEYCGEKNRQELLGFKGSCLLAPAECSIWTKFCEIDIIDAFKTIQKMSFENDGALNNELVIPYAFSRFETHMSQPVRIHNIYKLARDKANGLTELPGSNELDKGDGQLKKSKVFIKSSVPIKDLNLDHHFAEGCFITLADVILYACYSLCFTQMSAINKLRETIPLTFNWFENVTKKDEAFKTTFESILLLTPKKDSEENPNISYTKEETENCSLYKSDPKRYKPRDRIYTKQDCVEESLEQFSRLNISATSETGKHFNEVDLDCDAMLFDSYPEVGDLPEKRIVRKKQQLENLANAVISIAKNGDRIVDFCSGSGHLGIILAAMLPKCHIIFLENKAISLKRARDRAEKLNLKNCSFYQSNLDYFIGKFDVGTSLHACGTATDIVIWQCIRNRAKFVCCPCCYGSVTSMPHISYPRSKTFNTIMDEKKYLYIAHAADQAHNAEKTECNREKSVQGQYCMDIIDTDRKLMAEEAGYNVILTRLQPEDCTPKNRLLLGII